MNKRPFFPVMFLVLAVAACDNPYQRTMVPDYTIHVVNTPQGKVAVPPECPPFADKQANPYDNQPMPQFGCATARNLALMAERPDDLVKGRNLGSQRAATAIGALRRYDNNQARGLLDPDTSPNSAPAATTGTPSSQISGDTLPAGGGASGGGSSGGKP